MRAQVNVVSWDDGGEISRFTYLHASEIFPAAVVKRAGAIRELPVRLRAEVGEIVIDKDPRQRTLKRLVEDELDGFVVLHRGAIVHEQYPRMRADDRHLSFSVTKAFVGTALGILEARGKLDPAQPLERYVPEYAGTAWAGTRVRDIADMKSGMEGDEDSVDAYRDPKHKHFLMEAALGWQPVTADMPASVRSGDAYAFLRTLERKREPGKLRKYSSIQTLALTEAIERVTGERLADVLSGLLWSRIGAEGDALMLVNERGTAIAHSGMCLRLRDLARFGLFVAGLHHPTYQWDEVGANGELSKGGFAGQFVHVDPKREVVIAMFGTNATLDAPSPKIDFKQIAARVAR